MTGADKAGGQKPLVRTAAGIIPRQVVILSSEVIFDAKADGGKVGMHVEIGYRPSERSLIAKDCIAVECDHVAPIAHGCRDIASTGDTGILLELFQFNIGFSVNEVLELLDICRFAALIDDQDPAAYPRLLKRTGYCGYLGRRA